MANYYDRELQLVTPKEGEKSNVKIKVLLDGRIVTRCRWMDLNLESIESFQAFLDIMKEILEKEE